MAYVDPNYPTKKALKLAVLAGEKLAPYSPGPWPVAQNGRVTIEGPHYPAPHRWYAAVEVRDGVIVSVK